MARLDCEVTGLRFPNPVICGAGPHGDSAEVLLAALAGGAGGLVARTVVVPDPLPVAEPSVAPFGKDGFLYCQQGSTRPVKDWLHHEYPKVAGPAQAAGVPLIAGLCGSADHVRTWAPRLVSAGAQAIEFSTGPMPWAAAVDAVKALRAAVPVPIWAKLSLTHGEDLAERATDLEPYVDAFVCMAGFGPVLDFDVDADGAPRLSSPDGYGLMSGAPVHPIAVRAVFEVARAVRRPVIASGGAFSARDVVEFLQVGASLVQVATAAIVNGPTVYGKLCVELGDWLDAHGYAGVSDVQGLYLRRFGHGQRVVIDFEEAPKLKEEACIKCGICGEVCYYDAISAPRKHLPVITDAACFQCGLCVTACPTDALFFRPRADVTMQPRP